jgi:hypothetical protein
MSDVTVSVEPAEIGVVPEGVPGIPSGPAAFTDSAARSKQSAKNDKITIETFSRLFLIFAISLPRLPTGVRMLRIFHPQYKLSDVGVHLLSV